MTRIIRLATLSVGLFTLGCTTKESNPAELTQPATLTMVSGDSQVAVGTALLAAPVVVRVVDIKARGVAGVTVNWAASEPDARLSAASSTTDSQGQAQVTWTLGDAAGRQTVTATSPRVVGTRAVFQASNGASISGGVTLSNVPLGSLEPTAALRANASLLAAPPSGVGGRAVRQASLTSEQLRATGTRSRRLIVEFRPGAMGMAGHIASAVAVNAVTAAMSRTLASFEAAGLVVSPEFSPMILAARVTVPPGADLDGAMSALRLNADVESVTLDELVPMLEDYVATEFVPLAKGQNVTAFALGGAVPGILPNDPLLATQYWHYNMIDMPRAWATSTGSASVLVAVVDNGIRFTHPSITANLTNDGYNFVTGGNRLNAAQPVCTGGTTLLPEAGYGPDPTEPDDFDGFTGTCWVRATLGNHGLHVSGTIGAVGNDGVGGTGINWTVRIRPVRGLDILGQGSFFDIAQGVLYAAGLPASNGSGGTVTAPSRAALINMSLGGAPGASVLANAVTAATNAGTLIVASAGNSSSNSPSFPAAYPEVVSVVALGPDLQLASYSNVGSTVSLAAPGGSFRFSGTSGVVSSTWNFQNNTANYAYYQGTSMSAPHVTGVAALVLAANPGLTNAQLRARLQNTAVDLGPPGRDDRFGYGLVNAYNALKNVAGPSRTTYVRVVDVATGAVLRTVAARADGSYTVSHLAAGNYYVFAGQDEGGDFLTGVPGRRWGWYGTAAGPTPVQLGAAQNVVAAISIGLPAEGEPNNAIAQANRLPMNGYIAGSITAPDVADFYMVTITTAGTYYFETTGVLGSCGYGLELDSILALLDASGAVLASNDDTVFPSSQFCSSLSRALTPGTYYLRVTGALNGTGLYRVWARDTP